MYFSLGINLISAKIIDEILGQFHDRLHDDTLDNSLLNGFPDLSLVLSLSIKSNTADFSTYSFQFQTIGIFELLIKFCEDWLQKNLRKSF